MEKNTQEQNFYLKKRNIKSNKNIKTYLNNPLNNQKHKKQINNLLDKKKIHLLSPPSLSNNQKISAYTKTFKRQSLNKNNIQQCSKKILSEDIYEDILNYNTISKINEDKILLEKPKVRVKIHSTDHNRNTISSEKNNNPIKYKIHKLKPKNLKFMENEIISPSNSNNIFNQNKINYGLINSIQNSFDSTETNVSRKNKEFSSINFYYNMIQEKSLNSLNNNIENLINNHYSSTNSTKRNHIPNKQINSKNKIIKADKINSINCNPINHYKRIVYKKKIQGKKNNYSGTFSDITFFEKDNEQKFNSKQIYDSNNKFDNLSLNTLKNNKTYEIISYNYQTPNKSEIFSQSINEFGNIYNSCKNCSILLPTLKCKEPENKKNKEYIKIENYNFSNYFRLNDDNKSDTINIIDILNQDYNIEKEKKKKLRKFLPKINNNNIMQCKKSFDFNSPKNNTDLYFNNKKIINNKNNIKYYIKSNINNINKIINKNINLKNSYILGNSNSINDYNTLNTFNNLTTSKKTNNFFNNGTNKKKQNMTICEDYSKSDYFNMNKRKLIKNSKKLLIFSNTKTNNFKPKKLKNVITSIQYKEKNNNLNDMNIILSEFDYNGKLNIKVKQMNKSIEKVIREHSNPKMENIYNLKSPKINNDKLTYIKKNQGTHIPTIKKHNTINKIG